MTALYLVDDAKARCFEPFSSSRPVGELRAGAELIRARWERVLGIKCAGHLTAPHLAGFRDNDSPGGVAGDTIPGGSIVASSRCAPALEAAPEGNVWFCNGLPAALRLSRDLKRSELDAVSGDLEALLPKGAKAEALRGWWLGESWDLLRHLGEMLADDIRCMGPEVQRSDTKGLTCIGSHDVVIELGATIEPFVVLDVSDGPVMVRAGSTIKSFTRLVGPCYVAEGSQIGGGRVAVCSVGETCRAHGELSNTIFIGHSNKSHDGFVGHSIIGRWVNIGAGTITSNLKNTYGPVQAWSPDGLKDTGLQFLGTLFGDHVKTAIGTRLTTGCVIGMGANIVCNGSTPKVIQPFTWGEPDGGKVYELERFLQVAARAMLRRGVELSADERMHLESAYRARWTAR